MSKKTTVQSEQLLNVHEAAAFLGVNPGTIRRWAQSKIITGLKVGLRGDWRFTKNYVLSLAREDTPEGQNPSTAMMQWESTGSTGHSVQYYENDAFLISLVKQHVITGLEKGETCIIVVTDEHKRGAIAAMSRLELARAQQAMQDGQLLICDAHETLASIVSQGNPDNGRFFEHVGKVIERALIDGRPVRAFGEMVALLYADGNEHGALLLEDMWNMLQKQHSFSLVCAYPLKYFGMKAHCQAFTQISNKHTMIIPGESYSNLVSAQDRLRLIAELQQKAGALETEVDMRKKLEKQKDAFIGIASHELKTPVTSIKAYAQILERRFERKGDDESARCLRKMDTQLTKLTSLIHDLLDVTKIEAGELQFNQGYFDLNELVEEVIETMQLTTSIHRMEKDLGYRGRVYGDRDRIGQVIMNLLGNAIKYSPRADRIVITTRLRPEGALVSIQDFGFGIRKEHQDKIFTRFYRIDGDYKDTYPGMGLGLYIGTQIINRHGGRLWVESETGKGSTFSFLLPANGGRR